MIDHKRLRELHAELGREAMREIITAFIAEAGGAIDTLGAAGSDPDARRGWLHFIKGSARTLGASGLGDLCARLEGQPAFGPADHARLEREFRAVRDALGAGYLRQAG